MPGRPAPIDFYYGLGSRYSYLASTRIPALEAATGREVRWRPLYSVDLFAARGANPFADGDGPRSGQYDPAYRRADAEAWADLYGVAYRDPADLRFDPRRLALLCTAAERWKAVRALSERLFRAVFVEGVSPLDDAACARLAAEAGLDGPALLAAAEDPATVAAHAATIAEALTRGAFGVPSFFVDGRLFWGNDRLPLVRHVALKAGGSDGPPPHLPRRRRTA
ncbi:MAG TPA: DsbA family protein [Geminicoccaceae bacterium]|nr:DsbA family protein [Geminicoccaceae bacterium]